MASTLQLEFAQAMSDFKTMFPDMERDVIEAVLRANQGAVDATIDQLLAMSTDNQVRSHHGSFAYLILILILICLILFRMKNFVMNWSKVPRFHRHKECHSLQIINRMLPRKI